MYKIIVLSIFTILPFTANAGGHWLCRGAPPNQECEIMNAGPAPVESSDDVIYKNVLGRMFCEIGAFNTGWSFSKSGEASYFAPNVGAPSPFEYFLVQHLRSPDQFRITRNYRQDRNVPSTDVVVRFWYLASSDELVSGTGANVVRFSPAACKFKVNES